MIQKSWPISAGDTSGQERRREARVQDIIVSFDRERRQLARLSCGRQLSSLGVATGEPEFDRSDIAAGVSRIVRAVDGHKDLYAPDHLAQSLLMYLWAGDKSSAQLNRLMRWLIVQVSIPAAKERWKFRSGSIRALCQAALLEYENRKPCQECSATGQILRPGYYRARLTPTDSGERWLREWVEGGFVPCTPCKGVGVFDWSQRHRARVMGHFAGAPLHWTTFRECWDTRYRTVMGILQEAEMRGLRRLRMGLKGRG